MKMNFYILIFLCVFTGCSGINSLQAVIYNPTSDHWSSNGTRTDGSDLGPVLAYRMYIGQKPGNYTHYIDVPNPQATYTAFSNFPDGTYYVALSVIDIDNFESTLSTPIQKTIANGISGNISNIPNAKVLDNLRLWPNNKDAHYNSNCEIVWSSFSPTSGTLNRYLLYWGLSASNLDHVVDMGLNTGVYCINLGMILEKNNSLINVKVVPEVNINGSNIEVSGSYNILSFNLNRNSDLLKALPSPPVWK